MTFDLIIENGLIVDGTGAPGRRADVGVTGREIGAIGELAAAPAKRRLDAAGCVVSPGFIDIHNHSDLALLVDGRAESMIRQGVTTQVTGNCGLTPAPVNDAIRADLQKTMAGLESDRPWTWNTFGQFLGDLRSVPKATHAAPLVGHGAIRAAGMGFANRRPTADELAAMKRLTASAWRGAGPACLAGRPPPG